MNLHRRLLLLICLCAGLFTSAQNTTRDQNAPGAQQASGTWDLRKDEDGIRVYSRTSDSSRFDELRVETTLSAKLSSLAALILDIGNYPKWSFNSEKAYVLKRISQSELFYYSLIHSPWPVSDRDLAVHLHLIQDSSTRTLYIRADGVAGYIPEKKGIVRVPVSTERWVVTPLPGDRIRISYEIKLDPGASVPALLINLFSSKGPYETFCHLREQLKQPKYRDASLPFIRN
jgi:hypothetical protein